MLTVENRLTLDNKWVLSETLDGGDHCEVKQNKTNLDRDDRSPE